MGKGVCLAPLNILCVFQWFVYSVFVWLPLSSSFLEFVQLLGCIDICLVRDLGPISAITSSALLSSPFCLRSFPLFICGYTDDVPLALFMFPDSFCSSDWIFSTDQSAYFFCLMQFFNIFSF